MKKNLVISIVITLIAIVAGGGYCYYYKCVETETHYYKLKYRAPQERNYFGITRYSEPKVELECLRVYENDSVAVADMQRDKDDRLKSFEKQLIEVSKEPVPKDQVEQIKHEAKINALIGLIDEQWVILSITHTRNFDQSKIDEILGIWNDSQKVEEFNNKYKISVKIYSI